MTVQMMQQAQQNKQPDAMTMATMAEMEKANAAKMEVQRKTQADQFKAQTDQAKTQVSAFEAQTNRMAVQVDAQEAGATIDFKRSQTLGNDIDNRLKIVSPLRASVSGR